MKFDKDKFIKTAEQLGMKVILNSNTPGIFYVDKEENQKEVTLHEIFPELYEVNK